MGTSAAVAHSSRDPKPTRNVDAVTGRRRRKAGFRDGDRFFFPRRSDFRIQHGLPDGVGDHHLGVGLQVLFARVAVHERGGEAGARFVLERDAQLAQADGIGGILGLLPYDRLGVMAFQVFVGGSSV